MSLLPVINKLKQDIKFLWNGNQPHFATRKKLMLQLGQLLKENKEELARLNDYRNGQAHYRRHCGN